LIVTKQILSMVFSLSYPTRTIFHVRPMLHIHDQTTPTCNIDQLGGEQLKTAILFRILAPLHCSSILLSGGDPSISSIPPGLVLLAPLFCCAYVCVRITRVCIDVRVPGGHRAQVCPCPHFDSPLSSSAKMAISRMSDVRQDDLNFFFFVFSWVTWVVVAASATVGSGGDGWTASFGRVSCVDKLSRFVGRFSYSSSSSTIARFLFLFWATDSV
ncbi:hypothetical protein CPB86DRAFT_789158, partial [Serendipita vermifera]